MEKLTYFITKASIIAGIMLLIGLSQLAETKSMSPGEKNKALLKRLIEEGYNQRKIEVVDEIVVSNYVEHTNGITADSANVIKRTIAWLMEEAPDFKLTIEDMIAEGDKVVIRWIYRGKNKKFGKQVTVHGIFIGRFAEGKMVEGWQIFDNLSRYKQLGFTLTPPPVTPEK